MSIIRLEGDGSPMRDITCPACGNGYSVDWDTEYGDPIIGEHEVDCPSCGAVIQFGVYIHIQYTQSKPNPDNTGDGQ